MVHKLALILGGAGVAGVFALALVLGGSPFALPAAADSGVAALATDATATASPEPSATNGREDRTVVDTIYVRPAPTADATARPTASPSDDADDRGRGGDDDRSGSNRGPDADRRHGDGDDDDRSGSNHGSDDDDDSFDDDSHDDDSRDDDSHDDDSHDDESSHDRGDDD